MYRQIMVPLDGSRFAEAALPLALSITRRTAAPLHLVTVQEPIPSFAYDEWESASREWSAEYLRSLHERVKDRAGGEVTTRLLAGHVTEVLETEADQQSADLVVMATHGRGLLSRAWLGSVADSFLHRTARPVLLVRPEEGVEVDLEADRMINKVLLPLDGTELSEKAQEHAIELGTLFSTSFHLIRVIPYAVDIASPYLPHTVQMNHGLVEEAKEHAESYLEEHAAAMRLRDLEVTTGVVVDAQPGHGILKECEAQACDFIAMSTHGRSGLTRAILGSASDKVIRGSHVPLLLYRPEPEGQPSG